MLVLSRRAGQSLLLGEHIEITVVRVEGDQVRIGIKAPKDVPVIRRELLEEVRSETHEARIAARSPNNPVPDLKSLSAQLKAAKRPIAKG